MEFFRMKSMSVTTIAMFVVMLTVTGCGSETAAPEVSVSAEPAPAVQSPGPKADASPAEEGAGVGPRIKFQETVYDFGDIPPGSTQTCRFNFTNAGDEDLRITNTKSTCGCTVPAMAKKVFAPGETGHVDVKYHAPGAEGSTSKSIHVSTNDPQNGEITLTIKGRVVTKITFEPKGIKLDRHKENGDCPPITIKSTDGTKFALKSFASSNNALSAGIDPDDLRSDFVIQPDVNMPALEKTTNGRIDIGTTHPDRDKITIYFSAPAEYVVQPAVVSVSRAEAGKPVTRRLTVVSSFGREIKVKSLSSRQGAVKLVEAVNANERVILIVEITPPDKDDKSIFSDDITITLENGEELTAACRVFYAP